ncbi:hypothetical protein [Delftia tsuruhatensis]|uniref:hypothetical protein n=1 Tax=Delftia tsuruhatensis TaxID=180282 RepID=UPI0031D80739
MAPGVANYRGSEKHKNRPASGAKGTLCPEWTHTTLSGSYKNDPFNHKWVETEAHSLFLNSTAHPDGIERRYATKRGIAFEAKPTNDGAWHGYPIPWESVPDSIVHKWIDEKLVSRKEIRDNKSHPKNKTDWAL